MAGVTTVGVAASSSTSASADTAGSGAYTEYDGEYRTVVNVVEAGADNTGNKSITPVLESVRSDNTLLYFPPGRYYMDSQFRFTNFEKFGVVGENATLVPANYYNFDGPQYRLFRLGTSSRPGNNIRFEGFEVDQTAPNTGIRAIEAWAANRLEVRNIHVRGQHDSGTWGPGLFNVVNPNGTGIVKNFWAIGGGAWIHNTPHAGNAWRGPIGIEANDTEGTLKFRRCRLGAFPNNGLYASGGSGKIIVSGGYFKNSNPANIRFGGNNCVAKWPTIDITKTRSRDVSQRGIRIEKGSARVEGALIRNSSPMPNSHAITVMNSSTSAWIENTTIELSGNDVNHGIIVSPKAGETTIVNTDITHETAGGCPIWIRESDNRERVLCEYVSISGTAGDGGGMRDGIRCERPNCRFNVCDVDQRGRNGVRRNAFANTANDTTVYYGTYRANHFPFIEQGANTLYMRADGESYNNDCEAICLYGQSRNVDLRRNRLANGVKDYGCDGLVTWSNSYS